MKFKVNAVKMPALALAATLLAGLASTSASAALIDVNFVDPTAEPGLPNYSGAAAIGIAGNQWNASWLFARPQRQGADHGLCRGLECQAPATRPAPRPAYPHAHVGRSEPRQGARAAYGPQTQTHGPAADRGPATPCRRGDAQGACRQLQCRRGDNFETHTAIEKISDKDHDTLSGASRPCERKSLSGERS